MRGLPLRVLFRSMFLSEQSNIDEPGSITPLSYHIPEARDNNKNPTSNNLNSLLYKRPPLSALSPQRGTNWPQTCLDGKKGSDVNMTALSQFIDSTRIINRKPTSPDIEKWITTDSYSISQGKTLASAKGSP